MSTRLYLAQGVKAPVRVEREKPPLPPQPKGVAPHLELESLIDTYLYSQRNKPNPKRKQGVFHPSAGLVNTAFEGCLRTVVLDLLCAPRSNQTISGKVHRIFDNGSERHAGLQRDFAAMADKRHGGVLHFEPEAFAEHPWLPLSGNADGVLTMESGWRYVLEFKTIKEKNWLRTFKAEPKHIVQLNTYMGMLGVHTGLFYYENKNDQKIAGPGRSFRVNFDPKLFKQTEAFCLDILGTYLSPGEEVLPEFDETTCKAHKQGCSYVSICNLCKNNGDKVNLADRRPIQIRLKQNNALTHSQ